MGHDVPSRTAVRDPSNDIASSPLEPHRTVRAAVSLLNEKPAHVKGGLPRTVLYILVLSGAALIVASSVIHLHLWAGSYRHIPTIGLLFLLQGIVGIVSATAIVAFRRLGLMVLGAVWMLGTAVGLLLSAWVRLFGYKEDLAVPYAGMSLAIEFTGAAVLLVAAGMMVSRLADEKVSMR